ncbi:MAG TPA: hypothetical protein VNT75_24240 [Symbiobacteriaceae bacterium]|nr:hypothetical protein [Symbiobacteriaceae bacterium]
MTTSRDIRELITEQSDSPVERKALEGVAGRVEDALTQDVPYRPEFKAELRRKLMAQARRQAPPSLIRRPVVWGSVMGMAAAVGILAVGLNLWSESPKTPSVTPPTQVVTPGPGHNTTVKPVSTFPEIPRARLSDEPLPAGQTSADSLAGLDLSQGLEVYELSGLPDQAQFSKIAAGLKFTAAPESGAGSWTVHDTTRTLQVSADGRVVYLDSSPDPAGARPVDAAGAAAAAEKFLFDASLPIYGQPVVEETLLRGSRLFRVTYTWRVGDRRPVVNLTTVVTVSERGRVAEANGSVQFVHTSKGKTTAIVKPDEALQETARSGDSFRGVDLVFARVKSDSGAYYLAPYWRAFGSGVVRYVPALAPKQ